MTTSTATELRVTFPRVIRSEWVKFRTLRSSWWSVAAAILFTLAFGLVLAVGFSSQAAQQGGSELAADLGVSGGGIGMGAAFSTMGIQLAQSAIIALAVLMMTAEYASGMVRASLVAVPKRVPVLLGKAVIVAIVGLVAGLLAAVSTFFATLPVLAGSGLESSLVDAEVLRMLGGAGLYLAGVGLLALGLGSILRSAAGAMGITFALLFLVPGLVGLIPGGAPLVPYFPAEAGQRLMAESSPDAVLSPWTGLAVLLVWSAVSIATAAVVMRRRDA